jgi:pimeloyl-ACP methyl ester carboxylesterase
MPKKIDHPRKQPRQQARFDPNRGDRPAEMVDLVDPSWILKALGTVFAVALACAYATLCVIFSHSQWQLVLHPSRSVPATPFTFGLNSTEVHFGADATGQPQLDGWWIPSASPSTLTALILHSGDGSSSDALPAARTLHDANLNVLLFDYRGYGHSGSHHPTQSLMQADAGSALSYLTGTRHLPLDSIILYGTGVGGSLAVNLCSNHQSIPALILDTPDGDFESRARADTRSSLVPVWLLFDQKFPLADPLHTLSTPKLLISHTDGPPPLIFQRAADPKTTLELHNNDAATLIQNLTRFLDTYAPSHER